MHDGVFVGVASASIEDTADSAVDEDSGISPNSGDAARALAASVKATDDLELTLYSKVGMGDGQQANNPWLQEFPDPITKVTWDNYLAVSKFDAEALGLINENVANGALNGSYANVTVGDTTIENVPVIIQPGQAKGDSFLRWRRTGIHHW